MMFPNGHYEDWCDKFWSKGYKEAFDLQNLINFKRKQEIQDARWNKNKSNSQSQVQIICELCNKTLQDQDEFVVHCSKDRNHIDLARQFMDDQYDVLFEKMDKLDLEVKSQ